MLNVLKTVQDKHEVKMVLFPKTFQLNDSFHRSLIVILEIVQRIFVTCTDNIHFK